MTQPEVVPPVLNLFQIPPKHCGIQNVQWIDYMPVSQVNTDAPIEYNITGSGSAFTDLKRTYLHLRARITKNGVPLKPEDMVGPVNLWLHSLFTQCDVTLQQKMIYNSGRFYAYKSYIETLLNCKVNQDNTLQSEMYYKDGAGYMDSDLKDVDKLNIGLLRRSLRVKNGYWVDMMGPLHADLCQIDRLILNGVDIGIKLYPSNASFNLMTGSADASIFKVEIESAVLKVCKVTIEPDLFTAQAAVLGKGVTAKYPVRKTEIKTFVIPKGSSSWSQSDIFQNRIPTFMVIGFVSAAAFQGDFKKNPYNFSGHGLQTLIVTKNGQVTPFKPLHMNFAKGECTEAFRTLIKNTGEGVGIDINDFLKGYALYVYKLDDQVYDYECLAPNEQGNLSVEALFDTPLSENVNALVYAQFPGILEIDQYRSVTT